MYCTSKGLQVGLALYERKGTRQQSNVVEMVFN